MIGIGRPRHRLRRQHQVSSVPSSTSPSMTPADTPASCAASLLAAHHAVGEQLQHARARRRHALAAAGRPAARRPARAPGRDFAHAQAHAQHHAARAQRVVRHPVDELAQLRLERRIVELAARRPSGGCRGRAAMVTSSAQTTPMTSRAPSGTATISPGSSSSPRGTR